MCTQEPTPQPRDVGRSGSSVLLEGAGGAGGLPLAILLYFKSPLAIWTNDQKRILREEQQPEPGLPQREGASLPLAPRRETSATPGSCRRLCLRLHPVST